ncbi:MAG: methionine--tRNA ligase [Candidatus Staskawiczbacteria bacterium RIFCSPLOWO2_12_FULL_37_15]|uniref:methionine--tRNA ligase n=1 Tax=Candidatus Staskawiczbacteria bacterium RIFCSPLOWO2_12_FULL_37_15 TaxID=1802218 RepID=A0A1G2IPP9_9BACT|nr:MAG: methionine--tRNA ligase [Candidatus Staskawiczbacteria bacterium RIFCSPLOWO2_12_FULL_37_15]HXK41031.1 class I tRNA ligase family protein [Candidatus Paceibacterota bacterium]
MNKFYITTSIMYANNLPHLGFALELIQADVLARYHRLMGDDVWFLTGTDEHGSTVAKAAAKKDTDLQNFVDNISDQVRDLAKKLNISNNDFIRTSDQERHWPGAVKFWNELIEAGDLYKKKYKGLYCVGHESFIKKSELVDGRCPLHKTLPEEIEEENWFFKLTKYKKEIKKKIENGELKVVPVSKIPEILNLIDDAEDISVSRPISALTWGIPVPNDLEQRIWVWLDALPNYISAIGYKDNAEQFQKLWPADVHLVGKDITRFHSLLWPAFLISAGLKLPKAVYVHGFITVEGEKMSKTIGNVIDPFALVQKYGVEPVRYFLLREISSTEDGDFSYKKLEERYNGDLANNLGNLVSRTVKLIETKLNGELIFDERFINSEAKEKIEKTSEEYKDAINSFRLHEALISVWELLGYANSFIDTHKPWAKDSKPEDVLETLTTTLGIILNVAWFIKPFMPETSDKIFETFGADDDYNAWIGRKFEVKKGEPLFPRI